MTQKMFHVRVLHKRANGDFQESSDVLGGAVSEKNAYIELYNAESESCKDICQSDRNLVKVDGYTIPLRALSSEHPSTLAIGERAVRDFALSREHKIYVVERVA